MSNIDIFNFPIEIENDSDYLNTFKNKCDEFIIEVNNLKNLPGVIKNYSTDIDECVKGIKSMRKRIITAYNKYFHGELDKSVRLIRGIINDPKYKPNIIVELKKSHAFKNEGYKNTPDLTNLYLFKGRITEVNDSFKKEDMFHIPLNKRELVSTQRYSIPGVPCLYLAQNSYIAWKELGSPQYDKFCVSAFEILDLNKKIIDLTYPLYYELDTLQMPDPDYMSRTPIKTRLEILSLWPLILATSIKCKKENRNFKSEYIIPQLLMYCLDNDCIGIAYNSNRIPRNTHMYASNLAIPILDTKSKKYGFVKSIIKLTESLNYQYYLNYIYNYPFLDNVDIHAKGLFNTQAFNTIGNISTFNKFDISPTSQYGSQYKQTYDGIVDYRYTPHMKFDDYILYYFELMSL